MQRGFSLVETLVALSILSVALLLEMGAQWHTRQLHQGLEAESELLVRAEATLESVRAGAHPLVSGAVDSSLAWPLLEAESPVLLILRVQPTDVEGLCRVEVLGRSRARRRHSVRLETQIWQADSACS